MRSLSIVLIVVKFCWSQVACAQTPTLSYYTKAEAIGQAVSEDQLNLLRSRLDEILATHANGATELTRFVLTGTMRIENLGLIEGLVPQFTVKGSFLFVISDVVEKQKYTQATLTFSGKADSEDQAKKKAISSLNVNAPELTDLFSNAAKEISEHYNARCNALMTEADGKVAVNKHDEAIFMLTSLPYISEECNGKALRKAGDIYMAKQNYECGQKLNSAKNKWAAAQDLATAKLVGEILSSINHEAACFKDVEAFAATVAADVKRLHDQDFKLTYELTVVNEQLCIEAARQVGIAYGKNQVSPIYTTPHK